ncbi:MAG: LPS export ABC transporter periplasmic protein LptC [Bacteroidota bacterium]|nr:LPS export ABC transporter periplasmic protein LptC [Bacteroidota bacterium]
MEYSKIHKYFLIKAAFFMGCFFISSCENSLEDINRVTSKRIGIEEAKGVKIIYSIGDKTSARITAPLMLRHQEAIPFVEFTKTIHADFFNDSLQITSKMDAHYAKYMETESKVFLKDSVVVFNTKGDTLYCNELYWDRNLPGHEFYTDKPVRIRTRTQIIDGDGLDAPQNFESWHIINGRGIVRVSSSEFPQ